MFDGISAGFFLDGRAEDEVESRVGTFATPAVPCPRTSEAVGISVPVGTKKVRRLSEPVRLDSQGDSKRALALLSRSLRLW